MLKTLDHVLSNMLVKWKICCAILIKLKTIKHFQKFVFQYFEILLCKIHPLITDEPLEKDAPHSSDSFSCKIILSEVSYRNHVRHRRIKLIAQVGSCTAIELVGDSTNSSNENTFLEYEQNESIADLITEGTIFAVLCDEVLRIYGLYTMNRSDSFDWFKVSLICTRYFLNISVSENLLLQA
jgi:hypothetical protein